MDSLMVYIPIEVDVYEIYVECIRLGIPFNVRKFFEHLIEEDEMYQESYSKKIEFEVEVFYKLKDGVQVAYDATCHTVCPSFVSAWIEREAMQLFKVNQQLTSLIKEIRCVNPHS